MYVEIPKILTQYYVIQEFVVDAYRFYKNRIEERKRGGRIYRNQLKTIYIWATQDMESRQGYWSTWIGYNRGRKCKNHGRS